MRPVRAKRVQLVACVNEGAEDHGDGHAQRHALGRLDGHQRAQAADVVSGDPQRAGQQGKHRRHGNPREDVQALVADECGDAEREAEQHHQRDGQAFRQAEDLHQNDGDRRRAPGVPADLGETEQHVGQLAAGFAKAETAHQHRVEAAAAGNQAENRRVGTEQQVADHRCPDQRLEIEGHADLAASEHRGGEEGEGEQHDRGGEQPLAGAGRHFAQGVVAVGGGVSHGLAPQGEGSHGYSR